MRCAGPACVQCGGWLPKHRKLKPGRYTVVITATTPGAGSTSQSLKFRIVPSKAWSCAAGKPFPQRARRSRHRIAAAFVTATEHNVEIARRGYAAIARGDVDAIRDFLDPDVKWHGGDESGRGACRGSDQVVRFVERALRRGPTPDLVDAIDAGDRVVMVLRPRDARGQLRANVTTFRVGKVVEMVAYESPEAAFAAARA